MSAGKFPKFEDVILKGKNAVKIWRGFLPEDTSILLWAINHTADTAVNLDMFMPAIRGLQDLGATKVIAYCSTKQERDSVIQLSGAIGDKQSFTYLQMPVNVNRDTSEYMP